MLEDGKKMLFEPAMVEVRLGEQILFEIFNEGTWNHQFVLATEEANRKHAELMKKFPDMEHADPNALRLSPFASGAILWKFTRRGAGCAYDARGIAAGPRVESKLRSP